MGQSVHNPQLNFYNVDQNLISDHRTNVASTLNISKMMRKTELKSKSISF